MPTGRPADVRPSDHGRFIDDGPGIGQSRRDAPQRVFSRETDLRIATAGASIISPLQAQSPEGARALAGHHTRPGAAFAPPPTGRWDYDRAEIAADAVVHALGLAFALAGVAVLLFFGATWNEPFERLAVALYASALVSVLAISATYNLWPLTPFKWLLRRFDHAAIYVLIAGTYTPFLTRLESGAALTLALVLWSIALLGVALKLVFPGRFDRLAIALYLGLGWSGALAGPALLDALDATTLALILSGGIVYSAGVVFHLWESLRFQNAVWHGFVLAGSGLLYAAVFHCMVLTQL